MKDLILQLANNSDPSSRLVLSDRLAGSYSIVNKIDTAQNGHSYGDGYGYGDGDGDGHSIGDGWGHGTGRGDGHGWGDGYGTYGTRKYRLINVSSLI